MESPPRTLLVGCFILLTIIWGTTWAVIRVGLVGIPPFTGVALRFALAAVILLTAVRARGIRLGENARERWLWLVNGLFSFSIPYGFVYWSEQWLPSGLASVLFSTMPLIVAVMAHFVLPGERLTPIACAGILLGFGGIAVIYSEDLTIFGGPKVAMAAAVIMAAPVTSAAASVAVKRWGRGIHPLSLSSVPMVITAAIMGVVAGAVERDRTVVFDAVSVGAVLYLAIVGTAVTFSLYFWLLSHIPATRISLIAYTAPVMAILVGAVLMDEQITARILLGSALVLSGVALAVHKVTRAT